MTGFSHLKISHKIMNALSFFILSFTEDIHLAFRAVYDLASAAAAP